MQIQTHTGGLQAVAQHSDAAAGVGKFGQLDARQVATSQDALQLGSRSEPQKGEGLLSRLGAQLARPFVALKEWIGNLLGARPAAPARSAPPDATLVLLMGLSGLGDTARELVEAGSQAIVICLLQSHKNEISEQRARDLVRDELKRNPTLLGFDKLIEARLLFAPLAFAFHVEEAHAVLAVPFGIVHGLVGLPQEDIRFFRIGGGIQGNADAQSDFCADISERVGLQGSLEQAGDGGDCVAFVFQIAKEHDKLVAAETHRQAIPTSHPPQHGRGPSQQLVSHLMATDVVGPLEIITVHHNHAHWQVLVYQAISTRFQIVAVAKPRQFILV